ncbi:MAG: hypothetical protein M1827_004031 [Pycnora praestabilis]|nr:MAG: hypothetical protein M1827_004031 [Pycnora praestabilis]
MADDGHPEGSQVHGGSGGVNASSAEPLEAAGSSSNPKLSRKRTKTGCLTCRRRRIKCGEERPICNNCVKSKRNCEGYNQRVVFKDPMNAFRPTGGALPSNSNHSHAHQGQPLAGPPLQYTHTQPLSSSNQAPLPTIAPRPVHHYSFNPSQSVSMPTQSVPEGPPHSYAYQEEPSPGVPKYSPDDLPPRMRQHYPGHNASDHPGQTFSNRTPISQASLERHAQSMFQHGLDAPLTGREAQQYRHTLPDESRYSNQPFISQSQTHNNPTRNDSNPPSSQSVLTSYPDTTQHPLYSAQYANAQYHSQSNSTPQIATTVDDWLLISTQEYPDSVYGGELYQKPQTGTLETVGGLYAPKLAEIDIHSPTKTEQLSYNTHNVPSEKHPYNYGTAAIDSYVADEEDDYWDVETDDGMEVDFSRPSSHTDGSNNHLGLMLSLQRTQSDQGMRTITDFLDEPNMLSTYRPAVTATPLMDPKTARIFCHFVTATGPTISMYERHPSNPSVMFSGQPVPKSQQNLWAYTLPTMALGNQGLLHAMLALASLHIAALQNSSTAASLKHYHYALRRVGKSVGLPTRRGEIATLAASLLLGFYEVMAAEHNKWSSHLRGATQLVKEINFAGMTRQAKAAKAQQSTQVPKYPYQNVMGSYPQAYPSHFYRSEPGKDKDQPDENLISTLMGRKIKYNQHGQVINDVPNTQEPYDKRYTAKDMENFEIQSDLFWWYCKQDMIQSMISGNRLLLDYQRWGDCPPRAPIGRLDAVYGTMDHLMLLMGRISDFAAKDTNRKRKAVEANGGTWRPPPGMKLGPPRPNAPPSGVSPNPSSMPSSHAGQPNPGSAANYSPPSYGMVPPTLPGSLPSGFKSSWADSPPGGSTHSDLDLEAATVEAEDEWNEIRAAFRVFEESLGSDYRPLSPEYMQPLSTPFGPALYHRTYSIACIWIIFYTGRILIERSHPSMPPAAMVAAGVAASLTAGFANEIGRTCAGLVPSSPSAVLNPALGAALMECSLGMFFAGVQYQDAAQRGWTVSKLRDISRRTGWRTSDAIASGCEVSWMKAAQAGRGPPYQSTGDVRHRDDRIAGRRPYLTDEPPKDNGDRRYITVNPGARVHWAMGLLGLEEDVQQMSVNG